MECIIRKEVLKQTIKQKKMQRMLKKKYFIQPEVFVTRI